MSCFLCIAQHWYFGESMCVVLCQSNAGIVILWCHFLTISQHKNPVLGNSWISVSLFLSPLLSIWWSSGVAVELGLCDRTGLENFVFIWPKLGSGLFLKPPAPNLPQSPVCAEGQVFALEYRSFSSLPLKIDGAAEVWPGGEFGAVNRVQCLWRQNQSHSRGEHSSHGLLDLQGQHSSGFIVFLLVEMGHITSSTANCTLKSVLC